MNNNNSECEDKTVKEFMFLSNMIGYFLTAGLAGFVMSFAVGEQYTALKEILFFLGGIGIGGAFGSFIARFMITMRK